MTTEPTTGPAKIPTRQKIAIVSASIVVALVLSELVLRFFAPIHLAGYVGVYQYDEELGVRTAPNVNFLRLTDHLQEFVTNAYGTVNYSSDFSGWEKVVFTIGDSFTQGTGVSPDRHAHLVQGNPKWYGLGGELGWLSERVEIIKRIKPAIASFRRSQAHEVYDEVAGEGSYAWLKQWSASNGVLFADWCDTAMSVLAAQPKLTLSNPHSSGHYRPWVNRIVADAFAAQILRATSGQNGEASFSQPAKPQ